MGIEEERVRLEWVAAAEGNRFASIVDEMTEQIRKLGPFGRNGSEGEDRLDSMASEMEQQLKELETSKSDDGGKDG